MEAIRVTPVRLLLAFLLLAAAIGLTIGAAAGPSHSQAAVIQEDDPRWECFHHGNKVCGDPDGINSGQAWAAWDKAAGWRSLRVDPSKPFMVEYVGAAISSPKLAENEAAVPAIDGMWYVFRATVTE